jgi:parvulin-like peptidyl-prolyl isomerase
MRSIRRLLILALPLLLLSACANTAIIGNYFAPTAAVVNGRKIAEGKMSERIRLAMREPDFRRSMSRGGPEGRKNRLAVQREVLTQLVQDEVLTQAAGDIGVRITARDIDSQMRQIKAQYASADGFAKELKRLGLTEDQARDIVGRQLLVQAVQLELTKNVKAPEDQLRQFYDQNKAQFDSEIQIAHILICGDTNPANRICNATPEDQATSKALAARARAGESFADLAGQNSADKSTSGKGGDLGWASRSPNPTPFEDAAFALNVNQVSDPVQSAQGWHIIKVLKKGRSFEEAREEIEARLLSEQKSKIYQDWLSKALRDYASKIRVNRRYGRFDSNTLSVVPLESPAPA